MSVIEPSYAIKRRYGEQTGGCQLALRTSLCPQLELWLGLAWLGLAWLGPHSFIPWFEHSYVQFKIRRIKKEETTPDCPATMPRGPGTTPQSRTRFPAALSPAGTSAPAATTHRVSPTAARSTGEGPWHLPILATEPPSASQLTLHEITLNKYCYCWSAVVVIPNSPAANFFTYVIKCCFGVYSLID